MNQTYVLPRAAVTSGTLFDAVMSNAKGRFIGLENVTAKGIRRWSIASRVPKAAIAQISGKPRAPDPSHIRRVWAADKHAWRTVDLSTARALWFSVNGTTVRYEFF